MKRPLLLTLALALLLASSGWAGEAPSAQITRFLASRKVLASVYFRPGSRSLDLAARSALDQLVPRLTKIDLKKTLVRIEGFAATPEKKAALTLSVARAEEVENYLRDRNPITHHFYLIGFGPGSALGNRTPQGKKNRVDIALYDNLITKVLKTTARKYKSR